MRRMKCNVLGLAFLAMVAPGCTPVECPAGSEERGGHCREIADSNSKQADAGNRDGGAVVQDDAESDSPVDAATKRAGDASDAAPSLDAGDGPASASHQGGKRQSVRDAGVDDPRQQPQADASTGTDPNAEPPSVTAPEPVDRDLGLCTTERAVELVTRLDPVMLPVTGTPELKLLSTHCQGTSDRPALSSRANFALRNDGDDVATAHCVLLGAYTRDESTQTLLAHTVTSALLEVADGGNAAAGATLAALSCSLKSGMGPVYVEGVRMLHRFPKAVTVVEIP